MIEEMTSILRRKMELDYAAGDTRRDAHPKTVGLLSGTFRIEADLPATLAVGIFAKPRSFKCWVRASNSSGKIQSDAIKDARGMAIKLIDGTAAEGSRAQQDFVLLSTPSMPLGTVALFRDAVHDTIERSPLLFAARMLLSGHIGVLLGLNGLRILPTSPLDIRYWSTTPYLLGPDQVVKYSLLPTSAHRSRLPRAPGDAYLADAMQAHLDGHSASFDFCVQLGRPSMPIEDAAHVWDEAASPFIKVATLRIAKQKFRSRQRQEQAEALAFSPAHAWPEHAPIGGLNRARAAIYRALSKFRHRRDGRAEVSPSKSST